MDGITLVDTACFGRSEPVESATISGWFVSPGQGVVNAFIDGEPVGMASVLRAGELSSDLPRSARRFSYSIPDFFQDGRSHVLSMSLDDGSAIEFQTPSGVTRSNLRFRFEQPVAPLTLVDRQRTLSGLSGATSPDISNSDYAGLADPFEGDAITGWAICRRSPCKSVRLRMFIDGQIAGVTVSDRPREELRALGLDAASGGFAFRIPVRFLDGLTHSLSILHDDGSSLPVRLLGGEIRSKIEFTAEPATSIEGVVDGLHGDSIKGWVFRRHHLTSDYEGYVRLQVLCNGIVITEIVADQPRMDVAREHHCDPSVGFEFKLPPQCRNGLEFSFVFRVVPEGEELAGCPLLVKHRPTENLDEMRALAQTVGDLCAKTFKLQRQVLAMVPIAEATVYNYDGWARRYLSRLRGRIAALESLAEDRPLVSIVIPTYRTNLAHLTAAIESVRQQTYNNWELIIVDDASGQRALSACLRNYAAVDARITCLFRKRNGGISVASNAALNRARGRYVVLFDHDDLLVDVAIEAMVREALRTGAKMIYSDEDKIDEFGVLSEPNLKPDWNYRLLLGINYVCHLLMIDRALLRQVGGLRTDYDGAQDHDLILRVSEVCKPTQIVHLPEILYHWRKSAASTASSAEAKPYAIEAGARAVFDHLARRGFKEGRVTPIGRSTSYSIDWGLRMQPSVTILVPFKDQITTTRRCLDALLANTEWATWRVVLIDNGSVTPEAELFRREAASIAHVVVHSVNEPFNYSRLNNDVARAYPADYYVFLNNDVFLSQSDWLRIMISEALADPKVAVVGAKLLYPNATVQHAGVVLGVGGVADHAFRGIPADHPGYLSRARTAQQYSAVTAACMLCRGDVFMDAGGFDERELVVAFNDVDLCLKVGALGWRVVWTPDVVAEHHESLTRGDDITGDKAQRFFYENHVMLERWHGILAADPFYNPHFSRDRGIFCDLR